MATCRECLHFDMCADGNCDNFTPKSDYVKRERGGCEYCKEDSEVYRKMLGAFFISYSSFSDEWFINTGHCKPRQIYFCPMCGRKLNNSADMRREDNNA